ncbi:hypothetical protein GUJ93_ZPchr0005g16226 [Zizania palustris]|uniref:CP12 domain-containing protein n=1 Tax=Zizania palustris TaxID=103762 RepID=A0A8J5VDJ6_ZIZPA|nr:hypothetical protein GUJ93_ZPchr0005g16226 [Zizania palustris]
MCAAAWDEVEELSAAASHVRDRKKDSDPLEEYYKNNPETDDTAAAAQEQQEKKVTERATSPATDARELIAGAQEKDKLQRELNRKRARVELEEIERTSRSTSNTIDPTDMKLLGISAVEYNVSSEKSRNTVRRRGSNGSMHAPAARLLPETRLLIVTLTSLL